MNTVEALKELYKSFGGKLTDTYSNIADGIPVGNYSVIPDCFAALAEIAGGSIELPVVTQADAGDVLTVGEDGKWTNAEPTKELPTVTTEDAGDVLTVNAEGAWTNAEPTKELPTVTASDNGTLLGVANGAWAKKIITKKMTATVTTSYGGINFSNSLPALDNAVILSAYYNSGEILVYKLSNGKVNGQTGQWQGVDGKRVFVETYPSGSLEITVEYLDLPVV